MGTTPRASRVREGTRYADEVATSLRHRQRRGLVVPRRPARRAKDVRVEPRFDALASRVKIRAPIPGMIAAVRYGTHGRSDGRKGGREDRGFTTRISRGILPPTRTADDPRLESSS